MKTLALPSAQDTLATAIQPKPTKNEVIAAMAQLRYEELCAERKKQQEIKDKKATVLKAKLLAFVKKNLSKIEPSVSLGYTSSYNHTNHGLSNVEVEFKPNIPVELADEIKAYHSMERICLPEISEIKRQIRESMGDVVGMGARVNQLVANRGTRNALKVMLKEIGMSEDSKAITV